MWLSRAAISSTLRVFANSVVRPTISVATRGELGIILVLFFLVSIFLPPERRILMSLEPSLET